MKRMISVLVMLVVLFAPCVALGAAQNSSKGLGLTVDDFIVGYNQVMGNFAKNGVKKAAYFVINKANVKNDTIVLDGVAILSWHLNGNYLDAVTLMTGNNRMEGLTICEAAVLWAITRNPKTIDAVWRKVGANEKKVMISTNKGDIFIYILRLSDFSIRQGVRGPSLLVCTKEYHDNIMKIVKPMLKKDRVSNR